jgi:hypothetical protein
MHVVIAEKSSAELVAFSGLNEALARNMRRIRCDYYTDYTEMINMWTILTL